MASSWRSSAQTTEQLQVFTQVGLLQDAVAVRSFLRSAIYPASYAADPRWEDAIALSPSGKELLESSRSILADQKPADIIMGLFLLFFHHDIFIDWQETDSSALCAILSNELLDGTVRIPHQFGRLLYDRFNDQELRDSTEHMLPDQAWKFLDGTPIGVSQIADIVSGPLGLLKVPHRRYIPPTRSVSLWHCSDPACSKRHQVELLQHSVGPVEISKMLRRALQDASGPPSDWLFPLRNLLGRDVPRLPYTYFDICVLIADTIVGNDRTALTKAVMRGAFASTLRGILAAPPRKRAYGDGTPEAIAARLSPEEQLQLLFLVPNKELISQIDRCILDSTIVIPTAEIRTANSIPPSRAGTPRCELSSAGVRCSGPEPLLDFAALVWDAYESSNKTGELDWKVQNRSGASKNALLDYVCKTDPPTALKELVLSSEAITKSLCHSVSCPVDDIGVQKLSELMLWKIGFDIPRFSESLTTLRYRLEFFNQELLAVGYVKSERDRERIRSAGVNLFVSVEAFLDQLVSFNVWLLASDHFAVTNFRFDEGAAQKTVAKEIGENIDSGADKLYWQVGRTNTLGTSIGYMAAALRWMRALLDTPRGPHLRSAEDLPHIVDQDLRTFPFRHTVLWADTDRSSLERYVEGFRAIQEKIARSNLASIRNGLDHDRTDGSFPKLDDMLAFVSHLRESVDSADVLRYFPKGFWLDSSKRDRFGRESFVLRDYEGREHLFYGPSFVIGIPGVVEERPVIVAPGNLLGAANAEILLFRLSQSAFAEYWRDYPRRTGIANPMATRRSIEPGQVRQPTAQPVLPTALPQQTQAEVE